MAIKQNYELGLEDYKNGMSYKDIAEKYGVSVLTVQKSWKQNYWKELLEQHENLRDRIRNELHKQKELLGIKSIAFGDLVDDYMHFWDVKNKLIADINDRGVAVLGGNGVMKKNDSVGELSKVNTQMLKILSELNLKAVSEEDGEEV